MKTPRSISRFPDSRADGLLSRIGTPPCPKDALCGEHRGVQVKRKRKVVGSRIKFGSWYLTWRVPGPNGKVRYESLYPSRGCPLDTAQRRHDAAVAKQEERERREGLPFSGLTIEEAVAQRAATKRDEGKEKRTVESFLRYLGYLTRWTREAVRKRDRVRTCDELRKEHIQAFRAWVLTLKKRRGADAGERLALPKGKRRKAKGVSTGEPLAAKTKRRILSETRSFLKRHAQHLPESQVELIFEQKEIKDKEPRKIVVLKDVAEVRQVLKAAIAFDAEQDRAVAGPMVMAGLLAGFRGLDFRGVSWEMFRPDGRDPQSRDGGHHGVIDIPKWSERKRERTVGLASSPALKGLLLAMRLRSGGAPLVFGVSEKQQTTLIGELRAAGAPPEFTFQALRRTCASVARTSRNLYANEGLVDDRLGHKFAVARRHYVGEAFGFDDKATTLEGAMKIEDLTTKVVAAVSGTAVAGRKRARASV